MLLCSGVTVDLLVYSIVIPVLPFQLEHLGYSSNGVSALVGWLLFAYVSLAFFACNTFAQTIYT